MPAGLPPGYVLGAMALPSLLADAGHQVWFAGSAAVRLLLRSGLPDPVDLATDASLVDLSGIADDLSFPGIDGVDALVLAGGREWLVTCDFNPERQRWSDISELNLYQHCASGDFRDPLDAYYRIRKGEMSVTTGIATPRGLGTDRRPVLLLQDLVTAVATLDIEPTRELLRRVAEAADAAAAASPDEQRVLLTRIVGGPGADRALDLLHRLGLVQEWWPELAEMAGTEQGKEHHPEGDVWRHTLAALRERKTDDVLIGLSVLLHDIGKPHSPRTRERAFDGHAERGAEIANAFLSRLRMPQKTREAVVWMVEHHMIPGALSRLPGTRRDPIMGSPEFPRLLELHRCDLASSFHRPDSYYEACSIYRAFLRYRRNPFRNTDGKKLVHTYVAAG